jgi:hypothetical protein
MTLPYALPDRNVDDAVTQQYLNEGLKGNLEAIDARLAARHFEITADVDVLVGTTIGGATSVITADAIACDGVTPLLLEFFAHSVTSSRGDNAGIGVTGRLALYEDGTHVAELWSGENAGNIFAALRRTPSAGNHTYSIRGYLTSGATNSKITVRAGDAGGSGARAPAFLRIIRQGYNQ